MALAAPAAAQKKKGQEEEKPAPQWVISYALIVMGVGLGLAVVCRPSRRNKEVKRAT